MTQNLSTNLITEILNQDGFSSIDQTTSAAEGFQMAQSNDYHLTILDVVMPKISGIEIAKEISKRSPWLYFDDELS